jgi:hypothetical protein
MRGDVETDDDAFQLRPGCGVAPHHLGIVARHDMPSGRRQREEPVETLQHLAHMEGSGKGPAGLHVLVEMRDVGSDNHPAARRIDARKLEPGRMPTGGVQLDARRELGVAVVELDALPVLISP